MLAIFSWKIHEYPEGIKNILVSLKYVEEIIWEEIFFQKRKIVLYAHSLFNCLIQLYSYANITASFGRQSKYFPEGGRVVEISS